jgi:hypothetical protein
MRQDRLDNPTDCCTMALSSAERGSLLRFYRLLVGHSANYESLGERNRRERQTAAADGRGPDGPPQDSLELPLSCLSA